MKTDSSQALWEIAEIVSIHGLKGWVYARSHARHPGHLTALKECRLGLNAQTCRLTTIVESKNFKEGALIHFAGVDTPEAAKTFVGQKIWLTPEEFVPLGQSEVYVKDLLGARIKDQGSGIQGLVTGYQSLPGQLLLHVTLTVDTSELILDIPYCSAYFGAFDAKTKCLEAHHLKAFIEGMNE